MSCEQEEMAADLWPLGGGFFTFRRVSRVHPHYIPCHGFLPFRG